MTYKCHNLFCHEFPENVIPCQLVPFRMDRLMVWSNAMCNACKNIDNEFIETPFNKSFKTECWSALETKLMLKVANMRYISSCVNFCPKRSLVPKDMFRYSYNIFIHSYSFSASHMTRLTSATINIILYCVIRFTYSWFVLSSVIHRLSRSSGYGHVHDKK